MSNISALTLSFMASVTCHLCLTNIFCVTIYTKYSSENLCGISTHIMCFIQFTLWHSTWQIMITFLQYMIYKHFPTWHVCTTKSPICLWNISTHTFVFYTICNKSTYDLKTLSSHHTLHNKSPNLLCDISTLIVSLLQKLQTCKLWLSNIVLYDTLHNKSNTLCDNSSLILYLTKTATCQLWLLQTYSYMAIRTTCLTF